MVNAYITAGPKHRRYHELLVHQASRILIVLSDCLRCAGRAEMPHNLPDRIPIFEELFATDVSVLRKMLALKHDPKPLTEATAFEFHSGLVKLLGAALKWMEEKCPTLPL